MQAELMKISLAIVQVGQINFSHYEFCWLTSDLKYIFNNEIAIALSLLIAFLFNHQPALLKNILKIILAFVQVGQINLSHYEFCFD